MKPPPMFPGAHTLTASAVLLEGSGRAALYLGANTPAFRLRLYRVPEDARVMLEAPHPLPTPAQEARGHAMRGSRVVFESGTARTVLRVSAASVARELLEALEALSQVRMTPPCVAQVCGPES